MRSALFAAFALALASGCAELGVVGDGSTIAWGKGNDGAVIDGIRLPVSGDGYWVPPRWQARGSLYGTDEIVDLIVGVARRIEVRGGPRLGVGDLAPRGGGPSEHHRSHQTGRDVDILYFMTTPRGEPVENTAMRHVGADGFTADPSDGGPRLRFDEKRNWQVVRALITAREAEVEVIFLYEPLILRLLDHARAIGEPEALVALARARLHQPTDSAKHDDHMHVRIACPAGDRGAGCIDARAHDELAAPLARAPGDLAPLAAIAPLVVGR
ncbi:MAG: penicillin-insensitive murein endopeptidase [Deltaproteobacteria bacterium]|nr:penicillin-insensitive murein endopeptidase [Deltaproteobacteria bacterium]